MGLEQELIRGAGEAVAKDPYGRVQRAMDTATGKITQGLIGVGAKLAEKKKEREAEEEKLQKEQDDLVKGYDTEWEEIVKKFDNDGGLDAKAYSYALNQAKKRKTVHDACPIGPEGEICRKEARMGLTNIAKKYSTASEVLETNVTASKDPKSLSNYNSQTKTGRNNKAILAGITGNNIDERGKNDERIKEIQEEVKTATPGEKTKLQSELKALKESNDDAVCWNIGGKFYNAEDNKMSNLQMKVANDVKLHVTKRNEEQIKIYDKYKDGVSGGKPYDKDKSIAANKSALTPENITSVYYDDVLGQGQPLIKNLEEHPVFNGMTYSGLGITQVGDNDIIDPEERDSITLEDKQQMINVLADPNYLDGKFYNSKTSIDAAAEAMARGDLKRYNKHMYGDDFYKLTQEQRTTRISKLSNPTPGQVEKGFRKGGGIIGAQEHADSVWNAVTGSWDPKTAESTEETEETPNMG